MREVELPSGATLKVSPSTFANSKALYQAMLSELHEVKVDLAPNFADLIKEVFCRGFSSQRIESALWKCFPSCLYGLSKITEETFEPVEARGDYMKVCMEVARENVDPFFKSLYAEWLALVESKTPPK